MAHAFRSLAAITAIAFTTGLQPRANPTEDVEPLFAIIVDGKWGLIDRTGRVVVAPRFDELHRARLPVAGLPATEGFALMAARPVRDALIGVRMGRKWGFVDRSGTLLTTMFDDVGSFAQEGLAPAKFRGKWGFVDSAGRFVIEPQFTYARDFACGLAQVQDGDKWGLSDTKGRLVVRPVFDAVHEPCFWASVPERTSGSALPFDTDLIGVEAGPKMGYVNRQGEVVIPPSFVRQTFMAFREGLKRVRTEPKGKDGYIDRTGRFVIPPQFDSADDFIDGRARVVVAAKQAYIDRTGAFVEGPSRGRVFAEGPVPFQSDGKMGFVDERGMVVVPPRFDGARPFRGRRAAVCVAGLWGFIDRDGRLVIEHAFDRANDFSDGLALVTRGTKASYLDSVGTAIYSTQVPSLTVGERRPCGNLTVIR